VGKDGKTVANKENHICFENEKGQWIHIRSYSSGEQIRGTKVPDEFGNSHRLELLIFDDILKDSILDSVKEREKLKRWYFSSVMPAVNPKHHREIMIGTPMTMDELLSEFKMDKNMHTIMFPLAQKMPVPENEIVSSWPEFHTPENIYKDYQAAKGAHALNDWYRERMLEVTNKEMQVFKLDKRTDFFYQVMREKLDTLNVFTSIDMAVAKGSRDGKVAIITIGVDANNHWFVLRADNGYFTPSEAINILFEHYKNYRFYEVRGEKAALQQVFDHFLEIEMQRRQTWFTVDYLKSNSEVSKRNRIMGLQPIMNRSMIHLPVDQSIDAIDELRYQINGFTKDGATTPFIDLLDTLAGFTEEGFIFPPMSQMPVEFLDEPSNNMSWVYA